jgi:hypothetical protein
MSQRLALVIVLVAGLLIALSAPANAAATNQISGTAFLDVPGPDGECPEEPLGFADYPAIVMTGRLDGCWYTQYRHCKNDGGGRVPGER